MFWLEADVLNRVLRLLAPFAAPKSSVPVFGAVRFSWDEENLCLACTDLDKWAEVRLQAGAVGSGSFGLPLRLFAGIAAHLEGTVEFEPAEDAVTVVAGKARFELNTMKGDDFPELPAGTRLLAECSSTTLQRAFSRVAFCRAVDLSRPALTGVYWEGESAVATDGTRIAVCGGLPGLETALLLDGKGSAELADLLSEGAPVRLYEAGTGGANLVRFEWADKNLEYVVALRLLAAPFPRWQNVIPRQGPVIRMRAARVELLEALQRVATVSRERQFSVVECEAKDGVLTIRASGSVGQGWEEIPIREMEGAGLSWRANARLVVEGLKVADGDTVVLSGWGSEMIHLIEDETGWRYYWLPLRR